MLRTPKRFGSIHRVAIAAVAIPLTLVAPAEGKAEPRRPPSPGLQQLWREFPLDSSRGSTPSRARSIKPPDKIAPIAQAAATRPRANANARQGRALPVGTTPPESEDTPPSWSQLVFIVSLLVVFIVTLLASIRIMARAVRDAYVRRRRRVMGGSRHYTLALSTDAAPDAARSGNEPLVHDPRRGAFLHARASDGRRQGSPRKPNATQQSEVSKLKGRRNPRPIPQSNSLPSARRPKSSGANRARRRRSSFCRRRTDPTSGCDENSTLRPQPAC